jgi:hypothetical protein
MPEETFERGDYFLVDVRLQRVYFAPVPIHFLDKVPILAEELANGCHPTDHDLGLEGNDYFDGRPSSLFFRLPEIEQVGGPVELDKVADPPEAQFVVVEHEVEVLGLPAIVLHVERDIDDAIVETADRLLDWQVRSLPLQDIAA